MQPAQRRRLSRLENRLMWNLEQAWNLDHRRTRPSLDNPRVSWQGHSAIFGDAVVLDWSSGGDTVQQLDNAAGPRSRGR